MYIYNYYATTVNYYNNAIRNIYKGKEKVMPTSMITAKGQTTIPKEIRDYLHLGPGDRIDFVVEENGKVIVEPATLDVAELEGILHRAGMRAVPADEMRKAIRKRFKRK